MSDHDPGAYCNFAGGKCILNNTKDCPKKSILKHCRVLKEYYRQKKEMGNG